MKIFVIVKPVIIMRKLLVVVLSVFISLVTKGQNLPVEGTAPDLYVTHKVAPKENFYSIARLYNQPPKSIAAFNEIAMEKGLTIGQPLKIPLNARNFDSSGSSKTGETLSPLTHIVAKSQTIFKIASHLNVSAWSIRKWNNLSSDNIPPGTPLIIGYLKSNNTQFSASAVKNNTSPVANAGEPAQTSVETTETKQSAAEAKKDKSSVSGDSATARENKENTSITRSQEDGDESINETQKTSPNLSSTMAEKDTAITVVTEEMEQPGNKRVAPVNEELQKEQETSSLQNDQNKIADNEINKTNTSIQGTFEDLYALQASKKSRDTKWGQAATFKSTSGWQDKKYYVLINDVTPGTILKISSSDNKVIYAKVLGSMPEMKENNGLLLRISNAAASDLGIVDPKFPIKISYYQ